MVKMLCHIRATVAQENVFYGSLVTWKQVHQGDPCVNFNMAFLLASSCWHPHIVNCRWSGR